ncbi:MAG: NUDIX domain-containing protein [Gammaproteobacteria bacterium]|jgi:NADH pyrophosphatase NudC (nudix superfamily)|nr:NUDIX domain-containing protein [Gammaproteobacteria bacterium]
MVWKPHATVAAIIERDNKFLMVEELIHGDKVFNQPAGHLDPDENLIDAVKRETLEETAWHFEPQAITGIYLWKHPDNGESFLRIAFSGTCHDHDHEQSLDDGILQAVWKSRDELIEQQQRLRSPMVLNCIDDYLAGKRFPLDILVDVQS